MIRRSAYLLLSLIFCLNTGHSSYAADDLIGATGIYLAHKEDTLYDVARRHGLGTVELFIANPDVDRWQPGEGQRLMLPSLYILPSPPRRGIIINTVEQRLYYFPEKSEAVYSFPISSGRLCCQTPTGDTYIARKRTNPAWIPPASVRAEKPDLPDIVPAGPDNPLGAFALNLGWQGLIIHGTNRPWAIGQPASHGCIRMYPEDIARLYSLVKINTPVRILDDPISLGWREGELYMDMHPSLTQAEQIAQGGPCQLEGVPDLHQRIIDFAGDAVNRLDWHVIDMEVVRRSGIPKRITRSP